MSYNHTKQL